MSTLHCFWDISTSFPKFLEITWLKCTPYCKTLTCVMPVLLAFSLQTKFEMTSFIHELEMTSFMTSALQSIDSFKTALKTYLFDCSWLHPAERVRQSVDARPCNVFVALEIVGLLLLLLGLSAPKIWSGPQNVEMSHVTLTTPAWGIVRHHKTDTSCGEVVYEIWSL